MKTRHTSITFNPIAKAREFLAAYPGHDLTLLEMPLTTLLTKVFRLGKTEGRQAQIANQKELGRNKPWNC